MARIPFAARASRTIPLPRPPPLEKMILFPSVRLGIDVGGTKIEGVSLDGEGRELVRERIATPQGAYADLLEAIAHLVEDLECATGPAGGKAERIGIGTPGFL